MDSYSLLIIYQGYTAELGSEILAPTEQQVGDKIPLHMGSSLRNAIRHCVANM